TQSAPVTIYAVVAEKFKFGADPRAPGGHLTGVWKSGDGGATWTQMAHPETSSGASGLSICDQCNYALDVAVYPTDPRVVYVLTVEVYKSTDGGSSWSMPSSAYV